jgi:hypothetical protein
LAFCACSSGCHEERVHESTRDTRVQASSDRRSLATLSDASDQVVALDNLLLKTAFREGAVSSRGICGTLPVSSKPARGLG